MYKDHFYFLVVLSSIEFITAHIIKMNIRIRYVIIMLTIQNRFLQTPKLKITL